MDASSHSAIHKITQRLKIPKAFLSSQESTDFQTILKLEQWSSNACNVLSKIQAHLSTAENLSQEEIAQIIIAVAPFRGEDPWTTPDSKVVANSILERYSDPDPKLVNVILSKHVKPAFQANTHPSINISTGRTLPVPTGSALSQQDFLEDQVWKSNPGLFDVISWCLRHIDAAAYEELWPLVVPPLMILLDDHEVRYKMHGVLLTGTLLERASPELLSRTGVDALIFSSLKKCMTFLHHPMTPALLRAVIPTSVTLIEATTRPGSAQRFNRLCEVLGDGIIGSVWLYGTREPESIEATLETLPVVIRALGIGVARFLKALTPQLLHSFITPEHATSGRFQLLSARALVTVIECCPERMPEWKGTILDGITRMWVTLIDSQLEDAGSQELNAALRRAVVALAQACPALKTDEFGFPALLRTDEQMFKTLLSDIHIARLMDEQKASGSCRTLMKVAHRARTSFLCCGTTSYSGDAAFA